MNRRDLAAFTTLCLLGLAWSWPLAVRWSTAIPGSSAEPDVTAMVWNVGWVQHALETKTPLLRSDAILLPFGADLRLHAYGLFPALLVWPVAQWGSVVTAFNVLIIGTIVLNGCAAYVLFRDLPTRRAAAVVAAAALMLSGPILDQIRVGRPSFASIWITCAALVSARRLVARPCAFTAVALGLTLLAALFTDFQMLLFTGLWLVLLAAWTIWRERRVDIRRITAGVFALGILALPFGTIFYPALAGAPAAGVAAPSPQEAVVYSYRWWDYLTPSVIPRALGGYELLVATAAALPLMRREPRLRFWLFSAGAFLILALGPRLKPTDIPLPFALLDVWPPLGQFRSPYRLSIPAVIGLAAAAALVLDRLMARMSGRRAHIVVVAALALRVLLATLQHPLATQEYPAYEVYQRIGREASRAAIIEVPFGVRSGLERIGTNGEFLQYYQHVHRRPIINAMIARLPHAVFEFYRGRPSLLLLAGDDVAAPEATLARDFEEVIELTGAGYVLVHRKMLEPGPAQRIERFLDGHPWLTRSLIEGDLLVYQIRHD